MAEGDIEEKLEEITNNVEKKIEYKTKWSTRKKASVLGTITVLSLLGVYLLTKTDKEPEITPASTTIENNIPEEQTKPYIDDTIVEPSVDLVQGMFDEGRRFLDSGDLEKAIETYEIFTGLYPQSFSGWNNLAIAYNRSGRKEDAIEMYKKSLEIRPNEASVLANLGSTLLSLGRNEEARLYLEKALDFDPEKVVVLINTANLYHNLKDYNKALKFVNKALEVEPDNEDALANKNDLLRHINEKEEEKEKEKVAQEKAQIIDEHKQIKSGYPVVFERINEYKIDAQIKYRIKEAKNHLKQLKEESPYPDLDKKINEDLIEIIKYDLWNTWISLNTGWNVFTPNPVVTITSKANYEFEEFVKTWDEQLKRGETIKKSYLDKAIRFRERKIQFYTRHLRTRSHVREKDPFVKEKVETYITEIINQEKEIIVWYKQITPK